MGTEGATTCSRKAPGSDLGGSCPWTASSLSGQLPPQPSLGQGRTLPAQHVRRPHLPPYSVHTNKCSEEPTEPRSWAPGLSARGVTGSKHHPQEEPRPQGMLSRAPAGLLGQRQLRENMQVCGLSCHPRQGGSAGGRGWVLETGGWDLGSGSA